MKATLASLAVSLLSASQFVEAIGRYRVNPHEQFARFVQKREVEGLRNHLAPPAPAAAATGSPVVEAKTISIPVDHQGSIPDTFENRYWVYEELYKPGGPVFIFDGGEASLSSGAALWLTSPTSFFRDLVAEFNGIGIAWEHRYYGESTPWPINPATTTPKQMSYLTTEQALADVPYFADRFNLSSHPDIDLTPKGTPWIFVGGSYPGMRATFMREKYPDTIFASWSSSGPVEARVDMGVYFEQVYRGMNAYGFGNCTKNIASALNYIDGQLNKNAAAAAAIKDLFLGKGATQNSNAGVADFLTAIYYQWQNYGIEGYPAGSSLRSFCDWMSSDENGKTAPAAGWEAEKGIQWIAERWAQYPQMSDMFSTYGYDCAGYNGTNPANTCELDFIAYGGDTMSWTWQYCTQWGYFQQANFGPNRIVSRLNNIQHQQSFCYQQFPDGVSSGYLPKTPDVHRTNRVFGGWRDGGLQSRTMYTGGQFDPWRTLSFLSTESFAPKITLEQTIPGCNDKTQSDDVFGYIMPNAEHCFDFRKSFQPGDLPRQMFSEALKAWLPCWSPSK